jgi:ketosteroid isomerase-like protein
MSQENVEAVQSWVAAINRRDLPALLELADPAIEYTSYLAGLLGAEGAYRGHEGLRRYFRELSEAWEWFQVDVDDYRDLGDKVLNFGQLRAKGKASGLEVEQELAWLHTFREGTGPGRYVRHESFATRADALKAAGQDE